MFGWLCHPAEDGLPERLGAQTASVRAVLGPIIVGTDGSDTATTAVREAIEMAKAFDVPLHVVSVYRPQTVATSGVPAEFADAVRPDSQVQAVLGDALARARQSGVKAESHAVTAGDAAEALLDLADDLGAGLIVVGNKGIGSVRRFLGNVPSKVVHHAPCSTFVVHTTGE